MLIFVHIPKAGGSTLYSVIRNSYHPSEIYKLEMSDRSLGGFRGLRPEQVSGLEVIYGHMDLRVREFLPPDARYVTFLRDPIQRILSFYYYVRYMTTDALHDLAVRLPVNEWIRAEGRPEFDNGMVRRLTGTLESVPFGGCTRELLEQAKATLARFDFVGLTERFDESYVALCRRFGWKLGYFRAEKGNAKRPPVSELTADVIAAIERQNQLDVELYRYAVELFGKQMAGIDLTPDLETLKRRRADRMLRTWDVLCNFLHNQHRRWFRKLRPGYRRFG
jgi:hypothetical protein